VKLQSENTLLLKLVSTLQENSPMVQQQQQQQQPQPKGQPRTLEARTKHSPPAATTATKATPETPETMCNKGFCYTLQVNRTRVDNVQ